MAKPRPTASRTSNQKRRHSLPFSQIRPPTTRRRPWWLAEAIVAALALAGCDQCLPATGVQQLQQELAEVRDKLTPASEQPVSNLMVRDLVTVSETDPLDKVVRSIVDAHVHRILVTDEEGKLCGIISTIDVMASLLRAAR